MAYLLLTPDLMNRVDVLADGNPVELALEALGKGALLVDLRADELAEMKAFQVPEVLHLPHRDLADTSGVYLLEAARLPQDHGFTDLACLNGGMIAWDQEGLPLVTAPARHLHGDRASVGTSRRERETTA